MKVISKRTQQTIVESLAVANTPFQRLMGLLFSKELLRGCGLWLKPCNAIHMLGMKYPIDAIYLDRQNRVLKIVKNLQPNRLGPVVLRAASVIEVPAGHLESVDLRLNDALAVIE